MILPIYTYGQPVLRRKTQMVSLESGDDLSNLISDMWETMYNASGVGLAAPQIGRSLRLFVVDTFQMQDEEMKEKGIKQVFINAEMLDEWNTPWLFEEGCLSIPKLTGEVERKSNIKIRYLDESLQEQIQEFDGINARVIQHEYDHVEGILFVEKLKPVKRRLLSRKLEMMRKGKVKADYKIKVPR